MVRRRPPRSKIQRKLDLPLLLLGLLSTAARGQTTTELAVPSSTTFDLTTATGNSFFHLPSSDDPLYITLSLCAPPASLSATLPASLPPALFVSISSDNQLPSPSTTTSQDLNDGLVATLEQGFANVTVGSASEGGAWIGVWAPPDLVAGAGVWSYELDVSTGAPLVTMDPSASFRVEDSDHSSVLLVTSNWTAPGQATGTIAPRFTLNIAATSLLTTSLARSKCFVGAQSLGNVTSSETTRGFGGGRRTQYEVQGLEKGQNYTSWLSEASASGTRLFNPTFFPTKQNIKCRVLSGVPSCPDVAYSAPAPPSVPTADLVSYYDSLVAPYLTNFTRTLTTFPCNSSEFGSYSFVSGCDDCLEAYRRFVCATTIPRCTDAPSNATLNDTTSLEWTLPPVADFVQTILRDSPLTSRTPALAPALLTNTFPSLPINASSTVLDQSPFPYSEVPPCLDISHLVTARCPPFIGWSTPKGRAAAAAWGDTQEVAVGARSAGDIGGNFGLRAEDRFGNVFCNSLGSDLLMSVQVSSASLSSSRVALHLVAPVLFLLII